MPLPLTTRHFKGFGTSVPETDKTSIYIAFHYKNPQYYKYVFLISSAWFIEVRCTILNLLFPLRFHSSSLCSYFLLPMISEVIASISSGLFV